MHMQRFPVTNKANISYIISLLRWSLHMNQFCILFDDKWNHWILYNIYVAAKFRCFCIRSNQMNASKLLWIIDILLLEIFILPQLIASCVRERELPVMSDVKAKYTNYSLIKPTQPFPSETRQLLENGWLEKISSSQYTIQFNNPWIKLSSNSIFIGHFTQE